MLLHIAARIVKFFGLTNSYAAEYPEYVATADFSHTYRELGPQRPGLAKVIPLFPDATHRAEVLRRHLS